MLHRPVPHKHGERQKIKILRTARHAQLHCKHGENTNASCKGMQERASPSREPMEAAQSVGRVFFPLDEELALPTGNLAPRQQEHLVHLAAWMPFARVAQMLERLLGVQVSEETVRRYCEQAGGHMQAAQTEQAQAPWQEEQACKQESIRLALSADGAQVPLVNGEWVEVRTLAIGTVKEGCCDEDDEQKVEHLSYFSRLTNAETFTDLAEVEMRRRKVLAAQHVCAVCDGADGLQAF